MLVIRNSSDRFTGLQVDVSGAVEAITPRARRRWRRVKDNPELRWSLGRTEDAAGHYGHGWPFYGETCDRPVLALRSTAGHVFEVTGGDWLAFEGHEWPWVDLRRIVQTSGMVPTRLDQGHWLHRHPNNGRNGGLYYMRVTLAHVSSPGTEADCLLTQLPDEAENWGNEWNTTRTWVESFPTLQNVTWDPGRLGGKGWARVPIPVRPFAEVS